MKLIEAFYDQLEEMKQRKVPLVIPIGTIEYHAKHCSAGCDTLCVTGVLDRMEKQGKEMIICPPVWYGVASYAVSGPEKGTVHVDANVFESYIYQIVKSFLYGGHKNIYMVIFHQTEQNSLMPMMLACYKAAKMLVFEYMEEQRGKGWWGDNSFSDYYNNLDSSEDPFNFIKVIRVMDAKAQNEGGGFDHAGKYETSLLKALYPKMVDFDRLKQNDEWFARSAAEASIEIGEKMVNAAVKYLTDEIK